MTEFQSLFRVSDFEQVLCQEPLPLLVGGQAVNLWAMVYVRDSQVLARLEPFLSRDCDLYGDADTLLRLGALTHWRVTFSPKGQPSPVVGFLTGRDAQGRELMVEVLYTIKGLQPKDLARETIIRLDDKSYRALSPVTLLKAKLANFIEIPRQATEHTRNDLKHLKILIPCVAGYLADAAARTEQGEVTERGLLNLLEETLAVATSDYARRVSQSERLDFLSCLPASLEAGSFPKLQSFLRHRLAPLRSAVSK
jgi:hypothetical protein